MKTKRIATVHILLDANNEVDAADILDGLLTEQGIYGKDSGVIEWAYTKDAMGFYEYAQPIDIPEEDSEIDLADFIANFKSK